MSVELATIECIGIKVMCLIRLGKLETFKCSLCTEELKVERDCNGGNSENPIHYIDGIGEFYSCPIQFVSHSVMTFFKQYDYYEKYPSQAPSYSERNARYWQALTLYETYKSSVTSKKNSQQTSESDNMARMKKLLKKD